MLHSRTHDGWVTTRTGHQDGRLANQNLLEHQHVHEVYLDAFAIAATVALPASRILASESSTRRMVALVKSVSEKEA